MSGPWALPLSGNHSDFGGGKEDFASCYQLGARVAKLPETVLLGERPRMHELSVDSRSRGRLCVLQCSSTCAGGFQRRVVVCQDENGYPAGNCDEKAKPIEQRSCESGPCPQWAYGSWGEVRLVVTLCFLYRNIGQGFH